MADAGVPESEEAIDITPSAPTAPVQPPVIPPLSMPTPAPQATLAASPPASSPPREASKALASSTAQPPLAYPPSLTRSLEDASDKRLEYLTQQILKLTVPDQSAEDKHLRPAVLSACFDGAGWTKIVKLPEATWRIGLAHMQILGRIQHCLTARVPGTDAVAESERRDWLRHACGVGTFVEVLPLSVERLTAGLAILEGAALEGRRTTICRPMISGHP
jgi:hypothetical protein